MAHSPPAPSVLPRAVVWDLDGTLIDSAADLATVLNGLLRDHGLAPLGVGRVKGMVGGGIPRLVARGWAASGGELSADGTAQLSASFVERYAENACERTTLYPGAAEVLAELRRRGVGQAVCTNKVTAISQSILRDLGIADCFAAVVGGDSTAENKPHPMPIQACLAALAVAPEDAVMVGDSMIDVEAGHAAGLPVVLLRQGYSREPVDGLGAEAIVDGVSDVIDALATLHRAA